MNKIKIKKSTYVILISISIIASSIMFSGLMREGYLSNIENVVKNTSLEKYVGPLINFGFMSESQFPIQHATVALTLDKFLIDDDGTLATGDEYYANVVDQCVFHSEENFDPGCIICRLKDANGNIIGAGIVGESLNEPYVASTQVEIHIEPDPENPLSNEVQQVHNVQIDMCGANEGCTPGYWRQEQHFGSWTDPPYSPVPMITTFRDAFQLGNIDINGDPIIISMKSNGGGGKASQLTDDPNDGGSDVITMLDSVWAQGGGQNKMGRHATAALLNAASTIVSFNPQLDEAEIIRLVQVAYGKISDVNGIYQAGDFEDIGNVFSASNDLGDDTCPLGLNPLP